MAHLVPQQTKVGEAFQQETTDARQDEHGRAS